MIVLDGHRQFAEGDEQGRDKYNDRSRTNVMMLQTTGTDMGATPNIVALTGITDYRHSTDGGTTWSLLGTTALSGDNITIQAENITNKGGFIDGRASGTGRTVLVASNDIANLLR